MEVLTLECGEAGEALPVFSGEWEAEVFASLGGAPGRGGWRVRETSTGELVSVLCGPCARVGSVVLDPLPGMTAAEMVGLVGVRRKRFVDRTLSAGGRTPAPGPVRVPPALMAGGWGMQGRGLAVGKRREDGTGPASRGLSPFRRVPAPNTPW